MSETEHFVGKLKQVYIDIPIEDACKSIAELHSLKCPEWASSYQEFLQDYFYKGGYAFIDGKVFEVIDLRKVEYYDDIFEAERDGGIIKFNVRYYNGGCCFDEALGYALRSLNE